MSEKYKNFLYFLSNKTNDKKILKNIILYVVINVTQMVEYSLNSRISRHKRIHLSFKSKIFY